MAQAAFQVQQMTLEEFVRLYEQEPFEIINGWKRKIMPNVVGHQELVKRLFLLLHVFEAQGLGEVIFETPFVLTDLPQWVKGSRVPDVMYYTAERVAAYREQQPDYKSKPFVLVPDLTIEIVSEHDLYSEIEEKVAAYLNDGVRLIWIIDPKRKTMTVYAPQQAPQFLVGEDRLGGGDVLPAFEVNLPSLFV